MTCIDYMSSWVDAKAIQDNTGKQTLLLSGDVVCQHGTPAEALSDRGDVNLDLLPRST